MPENSGLNEDSNPDLCDIVAVLQGAGCYVGRLQARRCRDDGSTRIFLVFEMRIGMNAVHRHRRGQGSNPRSSLNFSG